MRLTRLAAALAASLLAACGDDDAATYGTCDRTAIPDVAQCIEAWGPPGNIVEQREACAEAGGGWSEGPCPTQDLIGCCSYGFTADWRFRECFYPNPDRSFDPENACTSDVADLTGEPGVWTPGSP
jgi:hypothetical protein